MDDLVITYTVGACLFGLCALITSGSFGYFVWQGRISAYNSKDHVHWLSSIWIYMLLATTFLHLTLMYALNATGYGFFVKTNLHVVNLIRWLTIAVVGTLYQGCLAYILTNDHRTTYVRMKKKKTAISAQNFFILFYYFVSQIAIFFATITDNHDAHILCMVGSLVSFIISIVLYFFPDNKIALDADGKNSLVSYNKDVREIEDAITFSYRVAFMVLLCLSYALNFIVWFLSRSNDIGDVISLQGEVIAYLVSDFVFYVLFAGLLVGMTLYYRVQTRALVSKNVAGASDGMVRFEGDSTSYLQDKNL